MKRTLTMLMLVAGMLAVLAAPAGADPMKGEVLEVTCTGGVPGGTIVAPANDALWTPGLATASTGVYIPYAFEFSATFIPDEGEPVDLGTDVFSKNAPKNTKAHLHGVCTFTGEEAVDDPDLGTGVIQFTGIAWVFWTGK